MRIAISKSLSAVARVTRPRSCFAIAVCVLGAAALFTSSAISLAAQTTLHLPQGKEQLDSVGLLLADQIKERLDAYARGDGVAWSRTVDSRYVLTTGNGEMDSRSSNAAGIIDQARETPTVQRTADVDDIRVFHYGDMAVVTERMTHHARYGTQVVNQAIRSTNTYARRDGRWLLIASQETYATPEPVVIRGAVSDYRSYVGVYAWGGGYTDTITREGDRLFSQQSGDPRRYELLPAGADRFFPKGYGMESLTFTRDARRRITGYVSQDGGNAVAIARKTKQE
jgi:Domain of unknown function (DUF4440)